MGTDIHFTVEHKTADSPTWIGVYSTSMTPNFPLADIDGNVKFNLQVLYEDCYYSFFAALAGVRGPGPAPKGVPEDASALTRREVAAWDVGGHSHSHLSLQEFVGTWLQVCNPDLFAAHSKEMLDGAGPITPTLSKYMGVWGDEGDFRVVFWFDN